MKEEGKFRAERASRILNCCRVSVLPTRSCCSCLLLPHPALHLGPNGVIEDIQIWQSFGGTQRNQARLLFGLQSTARIVASRVAKRLIYLGSLEIIKALIHLRKTLEDTKEDVDTSGVFAWKTQIHYYELKKYIIQLLDLRLPGKCSRGVHVFHSVFQRLPQKHEYYCYVYFGKDHRLVTLTSAVKAEGGKKKKKKKKQAKKR